MNQQLLNAIIFLYASSGIVSFVAYLPTIKDLWRGHPSANVPSYILWTACFAVASLYGFFILHDLLFNIVTNLQLLACAIILLLRLRLKK